MMIFWRDFSLSKSCIKKKEKNQSWLSTILFFNFILKIQVGLVQFFLNIKNSMNTLKIHFKHLLELFGNQANPWHHVKSIF